MTALIRDKAKARRARQAAASRVYANDRRDARDNRRFTDNIAPSGEAARVADPSLTEPLFPSRVTTPGPGDRVLVSGVSNAKIGGTVLGGNLDGAPIYTLTLPERTTCPSTCGLWAVCYGNAMPHPKRWAPGRELEEAIRREVRELTREGKPILVRLHILGDFYSHGYVSLWRALLERHPSLHCFGFTAHPEGTSLGDKVAGVRDAFPGRFMIRHSGRTGRWGSFSVDFPTRQKRIGDAVVCPEQLHAIDQPERKTHCGSCMVCWQTDLPIAFIVH